MSGSWLVLPAVVPAWLPSLSTVLWSALLVCVLLFVVSVTVAARAGEPTASPPDRARVWRRSANATVLGILGLAVLLGVQTAEDDPDPGSCAPPERAGSTALTRHPSASGTTERQVRQVSLTLARRSLRDVRADHRQNPTVTTDQEVRKAVRKVDRRDRQLTAWRPAVATVAETTPTTFDLGNERNPGVRSIAFTLDDRIPGPALVAVTPTAFSNATTSREIAPEDLSAWAVLDPDGLSGTLYVCVTTNSRPHLPSGQMTGSLVVDDVRLARFAQQVTLSLAYPDVARVMYVGLAIAFAASWYVFFLRRDQLTDVVLLGEKHTPSDDADEAPSSAEREAAARVLRWPFTFWWGYWRWATSASGVITIVAGMAAAVTAFSTAYLSSETWTGSFGDWFAYCGAVATAFVAGGTAGKLAQIAEPGSERKDRFKAQAAKRPAQPSWIRNRRR